MENYIARLRIGFISGIVILLILIGYGLFRYPLIIPQAGGWSVAFPTLMLVLYGITGMWASHKSNQIYHPALRDGTGFGLVIGMLFALLIIIENFSGFIDLCIHKRTQPNSRWV
jgi:hypothetical protein